MTRRHRHFADIFRCRRPHFLVQNSGISKGGVGHFSRFCADVFLWTAPCLESHLEQKSMLLKINEEATCYWCCFNFSNSLVV